MNIPITVSRLWRPAPWLTGVCWITCASALGAQGADGRALGEPPDECQITVTASPLEYRQFDAVELLGAAITDPKAKQAQPTQVICLRDVRRSGAQDVSQLLRQLPALLPGHDLDLRASLHGTGIRGKVAGTLVLLNGQRLPTLDSSPLQGLGDRHDLRWVPVTAVERIEVLTTGASSGLGSDATAGIVNIITRQTRGVSLHAEALAAAAGKGSGQSLGWSWGAGSLRSDPYRVQAHVRVTQHNTAQSHPLTYTLATEHNSTQGQWFLEGEAALTSRWTAFGHLLGAHESPQNTPRTMPGLDNSEPPLWADALGGLLPWPLVQQDKHRQQQWRLGLKGPWRNWDVTASASDGRVRHQTQSSPLVASTGTAWDATTEQRLDALQRMPALAAHLHETQLSTLQVLATREWVNAPMGPATWDLGWHWRQEALTSGIDAATPSKWHGQRQQWAVHTEIKSPLADQHELTASLRHDHYSDAGQAQTGQLGWKWRSEKEWLFRGWAGTGFRAPGLAQLQPQTSHEWLAWDAVNRREFTVRRQGNPDLQAEKSTHLSLGFRYEPHARWTLGADLWHADVRRAMAYEGLPSLLVSQGMQSDGQGLFLNSVASNSGRLRHQGLDYDIAWREPADLGIWRWSIQGTAYLKSSLKESASDRSVSDLAYFSGVTDSVTPRHVLVLSASLERGSGLFMSRLRYRSGHTEATGVDTRQVPALWRLDLGGQWAMNRQLTLSAWLKNASNRQPAPNFWRSIERQTIAQQSLEDQGRTLQIRGEYRF
jgi:outer membrane receptor for ferrienterochelin and colicin